MAEDAVQQGSLLGVPGQHAADEILGRGGQGAGKGVAGLTDAAVCLLQVGGLKWGSAQQHGIPTQPDRETTVRAEHQGTSVTSEHQLFTQHQDMNLKAQSTILIPYTLCKIQLIATRSPLSVRSVCVCTQEKLSCSYERGVAHCAHNIKILANHTTSEHLLNTRH